MFLKPKRVKVPLKNFSNLPEKILETGVENPELSSEFEIGETHFLEYQNLSERLGDLEKSFSGWKIFSRYRERFGTLVRGTRLR